jgi:hypothetical protein
LAVLVPSSPDVRHDVVGRQLARGGHSARPLLLSYTDRVDLNATGTGDPDRSGGLRGDGSPTIWPPTDGLARSVIRFFGTVTLLAALVHFDESRGPLRLVAPRTVFSNGHPSQQAIEPYLLFLRDAREFLPPGASVLVELAPGTTNPTPPNLAPFFYVALGQLPDQRVIPSPPELRGREVDEFMACFGGECSLTGYREFVRLPTGVLYVRLR